MSNQSNSADQQITALTRGRIARVTLSQITPIIEELQAALIKRIAINHSSFTDTQLRGLVGELAGFHKILQHLDNDIKRADIATKEMQNG